MIFDALRQRWQDWRRERRIADLATCAVIEADAGRLGLADEAWQALRAEIRQRSPQQVARMERRMQPDLYEVRRQIELSRGKTR